MEVRVELARTSGWLLSSFDMATLAGLRRASTCSNPWVRSNSDGTGARGWSDHARTAMSCNGATTTCQELRLNSRELLGQMGWRTHLTDAPRARELKLNGGQGPSHSE